MSLRIAVAVVLVAALAAPARGAPLSPTEARKLDAKRYRDEAVAAWDRGEYLTALEDFKRAYALYPSPNLRFNIAQVLVDLGRDVEAIELYEAFLAEETGAPADARATAQAKITELERKVGRLTLRCATPNAEVAVDGKPVGTAPLTRTLRLSPGAHEVTARRAQSLPFIAPIALKAGEATSLKIDLKSSRPLWKRGWFWGVVSGVVVASAGIAVAVAVTNPTPQTANATLVLNAGSGTASAP